MPRHKETDIRMFFILLLGKECLIYGVRLPSPMYQKGAVLAEHKETLPRIKFLF
jgi:hypothetical protein